MEDRDFDCNMMLFRLKWVTMTKVVENTVALMKMFDCLRLWWRSTSR